MKLLFKLVIALAVLAAAAGFVGIWYVKPEQKLDLRYKPVSVTNKMKQMLYRMKFDVILSEEEVNDLLKNQLTNRRDVSESFEITGARFYLLPNQLKADVTLKYKHRIDVGATVYYTLHWNKPYIVVKFKRAQIKDVQIPSAWLNLPSFSIPVTDRLPSFADVNNIIFEKERIHIFLNVKTAETSIDQRK